MQTHMMDHCFKFQHEKDNVTISKGFHDHEKNHEHVFNPWILYSMAIIFHHNSNQASVRFIDPADFISQITHMAIWLMVIHGDAY